MVFRFTCFVVSLQITSSPGDQAEMSGTVIVLCLFFIGEFGWVTLVGSNYSCSLSKMNLFLLHGIQKTEYVILETGTLACTGDVTSASFIAEISVRSPRKY